MKTNELAQGILVGLLLVSPFAVAETQYPASDFEPEIVYQDTDYISKQGGKPSKAAPAKKTKKAAAAKPASTSKYPAADFEPEIVYQDTDYISKGGPARPAKRAAASAQAPQESAGAEAEESGGGLMENYWLGLVILAVAGFAIYSKQMKPKAATEANPVYTIDPTGLTGVARYMQRKNLTEPTGVARYIERQPKDTGVDKYLRRRG